MTDTNQGNHRQQPVDGIPAVETPAFTSFITRILAAAGRRIGKGDIGSLHHLVALRDDLETAIATAVHGLHQGPPGYSWAEIGTELGITKQAAQQRYGANPNGEPDHA